MPNEVEEADDGAVGEREEPVLEQHVQALWRAASTAPLTRRVLQEEAGLSFLSQIQLHGLPFKLTRETLDIGSDDGTGAARRREHLERVQIVGVHNVVSDQSDCRASLRPRALSPGAREFPVRDVELLRRSVCSTFLLDMGNSPVHDNGRDSRRSSLILHKADGVARNVNRLSWSRAWSRRRPNLVRDVLVEEGIES